MQSHPLGTIISLGEGLETQRERVDNGKIRWLTVDLPEVIDIREKFLKSSDERFENAAQSAFDTCWMDRVDPSHGVFIVAQGLFMYFTEDEVRPLVQEIFNRFPQAHLVFDFVSKGFVKKTQKGFALTENYTLPAMGWGVSHDEVKHLLTQWLQGQLSIQTEHYDVFARGFRHFIVDMVMRNIPIKGKSLPGIAHVFKR
jgi:O-methyltransferase involved in polyketide biosynthesis